MATPHPPTPSPLQWRGGELRDEALYEKVREGDETALTELVGRYHRPLHAFLFRYTGDAALADDLAQETFTRLLTYRGEAPDHFKAWAYAIARNLAHDHFKTARVRYERLTDFSDDADDIADDERFEVDSFEDVGAALAKLSPEHREVVILRFYHDLKLEEIAEITHAPLGTVKSRLFHALKGLKGFLSVTEIAHDRA